MPNQIGLYPRSIAIGKKIGVVSSISAKPSSIEPNNKRINAITIMAVTGPASISSTRFDKNAAIPVTLIKVANNIAPMMIT